MHPLQADATKRDLKPSAQCALYECRQTVSSARTAMFGSREKVSHQEKYGNIDLNTYLATVVKSRVLETPKMPHVQFDVTDFCLSRISVTAMSLHADLIDAYHDHVLVLPTTTGRLVRINHAPGRS